MGAYDSVLAELKSKQKNNVVSEVESTKSPKLVNNQSEESLSINVYFLGSCHYAYKHPNAGKPFNNNKHVYFKEEKKNLNKEDGNFEVYFTFSGPTALDIKKPTIKSMTRLGIEVLKRFIDEKVEAYKTSKITVNIKGHSRGAIIAKNVYGELKQSYKLNKNIEFGTLSLFDPYAGPLNGYKKTYDNIDIDDADIAVVYSLTEGLYASPSKVKNAKIVIFTDCEHDKTKYIGRAIPTLTEKGTYYFDGNQEELRAITVGLKEEPEDPNQSYEEYIKDVYKKIDNHLKGKIKLINPENCWKVLERFSNIKSYRRKETFYGIIAKIEGCQDIVESYLKQKKQNRLLKSLGFNSK